VWIQVQSHEHEDLFQDLVINQILIMVRDEKFMKMRSFRLCVNQPEQCYVLRSFPNLRGLSLVSSVPNRDARIHLDVLAFLPRLANFIIDEFTVCPARFCCPSYVKNLEIFDITYSDVDGNSFDLLIELLPSTLVQFHLGAGLSSETLVEFCYKFPDLEAIGTPMLEMCDYDVSWRVLCNYIRQCSEILRRCDA
jgi:hypothetical protein